MDRAILLVDDDENLLSGLVRALREQPFKVYTARDGKEAIRLLQTRKIDVIVADERMPGMSGVQLSDVGRRQLPRRGADRADRACRGGDGDPGDQRRGRVPLLRESPATRPGWPSPSARPWNGKRRWKRAGARWKPSSVNCRNCSELGHDVKFQARIAAEDLQRPIERILECCRRLEEQSGDGMDSTSQALLAEARRAAAEARRLVLQLQAAVAARNSMNDRRRQLLSPTGTAQAGSLADWHEPLIVGDRSRLLRNAFSPKVGASTHAWCRSRKAPVPEKCACCLLNDACVPAHILSVRPRAKPVKTGVTEVLPPLFRAR